VQTLVHYPTPPALQPAYRDSLDASVLARRWADEVLSLPVGPHLTEPQQDRVIAALKDVLARQPSR
jgi:dTDP-3-amino-3,4,6-trideoxy-alpha-D-glucose transaminase